MMDEIDCSQCGQPFQFNEELGINVKFFPAGSSHGGYSIGGDFPWCPHCDAKNYRVQRRGYNEGDAKGTSYRHVIIDDPYLDEDELLRQRFQSDIDRRLNEVMGGIIEDLLRGKR